MTMQRLVWQAKVPTEITITDEGKPFTVRATPVVTTHYLGITVGYFYRTHDAFGYWNASRTCTLITAWRVAHILPLVKSVRNQNMSDGTVARLVLAVEGDHHETRTFETSRDLDMTVDELGAELVRVQNLWPSAAALCSMWDQLPTHEQDKLSGFLRTVIETGQVEGTPELIHRVEIAELRLRDVAQQKQHEDVLIRQGLSPEDSLFEFMMDIGVTELAYTLGFGELGDPVCFPFCVLDQAIMAELIGSSGYHSRIRLLAWGSSDEHIPPRIMLGGEPRELLFVRWDHVTERFVLTLRPLGLNPRDDRQDEQLSIADLRARIGVDMGLDSPLPPRTRAPWLVHERPASRVQRWLRGKGV
jgi:hypothetical protein